MIYRKANLAILLIFIILLKCNFIFAQIECSNSFNERRTFTGDWYGKREQLKNSGLIISSGFSTDVNGNPIGGLKKHATYAGFFDLAASLDFEKMFGVKGLTLLISNCIASGQNLSNYIGNFFGVQEVFASGNYYLTELRFSKAAFNDKIVFEIGRLFAGDVFATNEFWQYYLSASVNDKLDLGANIVFPAYNITSWASRLIFEPNDNWQFFAGIYNDNHEIEDTNKHGFCFKLNLDDACLSIGQIIYKHDKYPEDKGYPGSIAIGGYYQSSKYPYLSDPTKFKRGNYGFYLIFDQMIFKNKWPEYKGPSYLRSKAKYAEKSKYPYHRQVVYPKDNPMGLTFWFGSYFAPDQNINTLIYQIAMGLIYQSIFSSRQYDVSAFCFSMGKFSDKLNQKREYIFELNHRFQINQWFYFTPDFQYILKPSGKSNISNAFVLGIESSINF